MKKLELKHIAGYLPYELKIKIRPFKGFEILTPLNLYINFESIIPILRPLSDLTKEIEVNGEKFVPIKKLDWEEYWGESGMGQLIYCEYGESPKTTVNVLDYLYDLEKLYEWHFDIHDLIGKGLAIDINTL